MKRILFVLASIVLAAGPARAGQETDAAEFERAADHLAKTRDTLLAATAGLSAEQANFKPAPDRWSVAEVAEHIAATETSLMNLVRDQVMKSPPRTEPANLAELDGMVLKGIADRSTPRQAPEPLRPTKRFGDMASTLKHFKEARADTLAFLDANRNELRGHAMASPLGVELDAYQWILFISAHCERHTKQIEEVKADPKFPKA